MDELLENLEEIITPVEPVKKEVGSPEPALTPESVESSEPEAKSQSNAEENATAPEAEAPEAKPKVKRQRQIPIPKDSASFFRARAKDPKSFKFTADGDLQVPEMRGEAPKVIKLPFYRPATADEIRETEETQMDELKGVEREIDEIAKQLRDAIVEWRTTGAASDVIQYQRDLQRLDAQRTQLRSPVRWTKKFKNLSIRDILVEQTHEVKKLGYPVEALRMRGITFEKMVRSSEAPFPSVVSASASPSAEASEAEEEETFVVFYSATDPEHGLLSPDTMVEFVFNSTKYNSLLQAYQTERVTTLGRKELRAAILKSRSPTQIRIIGSKVVGQVEDPRALWINILKSLVSQHPRFGDAVTATGDATLVFADPRDGVLGIGMPVEDPQVTDREAWKGTNLLGQAWQAVRTSLKEMAEKPEAQKGGNYTEHGTTNEEARQTRSRVLMGRYRRKA